MVVWLTVAMALAAVPAEVTPVLAPADAPAQFAEHVGGPSPSLACDPLWSDALVCFKVREGKKRRWVTSADLAKWKVDAPALRATLAERAIAKLADQPKPVPVEGMPGAQYWVAAEGDGWAAAGVLQPSLLAERLGGAPILVAVPVDGVLIAWKIGDRELDRIVAVGVKEMYDAGDGPVTPIVHQWTGARWAPYAEAVPSKPPLP